MLLWEKRAFLKGASIIIGVDEVGRGPLAGPVVAAAFLFHPLPLKKFIPPSYKEKIDDSKKLSPMRRQAAFSEIVKKSLFGIAVKDHIFIDTKNIYRSTLAAMKDAVNNLIRDFCRLNNKKENDIKKDICILIDGKMNMDFPYKTFEIIKGDSKSFSIASASIIAKVTRDRMMEEYDKIYPLYGFRRHKGYGTRLHLEAIQQYGPCPIHRRSFAPLKAQTA